MRVFRLGVPDVTIPAYSVPDAAIPFSLIVTVANPRWFGSQWVSAGGWSTRWFHYRDNGVSSPLLPGSTLYGVSALAGISAMNTFEK